MKKLILLFTIICASQLFGMEPEKLTPKGAVEIYQESLPELKQEIINKALAASNTLDEAIQTIQKLSILHNVSVNNDTLIKALTKKFLDKVKGEIVLAIEEPKIYQKLATILKKNKYFEEAIDTLKKENLLQNNLKIFTALVHMLTDRYNVNMYYLFESFNIPITEEYLELNRSLLVAINQFINDNNGETTFKESINKDADVDFIDHCTYRTPLSLAISQNQTKIVKLLLDAGANPNFKNPKDLSPSQYMESVGASQEIKDLIENAIKQQ